MTNAKLLLAVVLVACAATAEARDKVRTERVRFKSGATSASAEGAIKGYETVDYVVGARKGQVMNASLATKHGATYFNILAPGQTEAALFDGSTSSNQFEGPLPANGDYKLRVYMMRSAARRNEVAHYRLEIAITGAGERLGPLPGDAKVPGTNYHATGEVPCAMGGGQPTGSCPFGVVREGAGKGRVTITKPDGRTRTIFFEKSRATGYDESAADPGTFRASHEGETTTVHIGGERYEIPDVVIEGG